MFNMHYREQNNLWEPGSYSDFKADKKLEFN